jgi:hypothetical protein
MYSTAVTQEFAIVALFKNSVQTPARSKQQENNLRHFTVD